MRGCEKRSEPSRPGVGLRRAWGRLGGDVVRRAGVSLGARTGEQCRGEGRVRRVFRSASWDDTESQETSEGVSQAGGTALLECGTDGSERCRPLTLETAQEGVMLRWITIADRRPVRGEARGEARRAAVRDALLERRWVDGGGEGMPPLGSHS